jgi:hypothetical protein
LIFLTFGTTIGVLSENRTLPFRPGKHMIARNQWQLEQEKMRKIQHLIPIT